MKKHNSFYFLALILSLFLTTKVFAQDKSLETEIIIPPENIIEMSFDNWSFYGFISIGRNAADLRLINTDSQTKARFHCDDRSAWINLNDKGYSINSKNINCDVLYSIIETTSKNCPLKIKFNSSFSLVQKIEATCPVKREK